MISNKYQFILFYVIYMANQFFVLKLSVVKNDMPG